MANNQVQDGVFTGQEDLGNGNYAFFILEGQFDSDNGQVKNFNGETDGLFTRQSVLGVGGKYGEVMFGRLYNGSGPAGRNQTLAQADAFKTAWVDASCRTLSLENTLRLRNAVNIRLRILVVGKLLQHFRLRDLKILRLQPGRKMIVSLT